MLNDHVSVARRLERPKIDVTRYVEAVASQYKRFAEDPFKLP